MRGQTAVRQRVTAVEDGTSIGPIIGVRTTKIYCLPSCRPPRAPKPENRVPFGSQAEARAAGFRACKLCKPDAAEGTRGGGAMVESRVQSMNAYVDTVESPAGPLLFAVNEDGALLRLKFAEGRYEQSIEQELAQAGYRVTEDRGRTAGVREQLRAYSAGERRTFSVPLMLIGTEWQRAVWTALTRIPFGETRTYAQVAAALGRPKAARAMGRANATNPLPLVVPCHRVIGADGSLTGFAGGTHIKQALLEHEARVAARDPATVGVTA